MQNIFTHLPQHVAVHIFEDFIKAKFAEPLHGVANEGGCPSFAEAHDTLLLHCHFEALNNVAIFCRIYLNAAFDEIKWYDSCVCDSTTQDSSESTQGKVLCTSKLTAVTLCK